MKAPWNLTLREFSRRRSGSTARLYQQMVERTRQGGHTDYNDPLAIDWRRADAREQKFWTGQVRPLLARWIRAEEPAANDFTVEYAMGGHWRKTDLELHQTVVFAALRLGLPVPANVLRGCPEVVADAEKVGGIIP